MKVEIYPRAKADIIHQFRYYLVDQDAPAVAFRFRDAVRESVDQLKLHPRVGTLFQGSISGLRSWPVKGFDAIRIYYTVELPTAPPPHRGDQPQQQYQKRLLRPETQVSLSPHLRRILALDEQRNDKLSSKSGGRSGFLK